MKQQGKVGIHQSKAGVPVTLLPERGCLGYLSVNKEGKATSIVRINPLAIPNDIWAEYSDFATFFLSMKLVVGIQKEGEACHILPESSQCLSLCRSWEGKDFGTFGINPSAVDCNITAEHNVLTAFCFAKTFHKQSFLLLGWLTAARELRCTIATRKPEADRATGFCLSSLKGRGQRGWRWFLFAERRFTPSFRAAKIIKLIN